MKRKPAWFVFLGLAGSLALAPAAWAQRRPYIGYAYPAGGQIGVTFQVKLGGQDLDDVTGVLVTGSGVTARVANYYRRLNNQEVQLLREQLKQLKQGGGATAPVIAEPMMMGALTSEKGPAGAGRIETTPDLIAKIDQRIRNWVQTPACASISSIVIAEVTIGPDADPGRRELRLVTPRGVTNPLAFEVGQLLEDVRPAMLTATIQILGKEAAALRQRPANEVERRISLPCTVNGQIASGEVNRYRFEASKGEHLVISTHARELVPYVADAVPGWFQPVLSLYDAQGREVAYADDYRFKPDPVILYEIPKDGEYGFEIHDSLYRGREDFVYRITVGDLPFVTSVFPLGGQVGRTLPPGMTGWNLGDAQLASPRTDVPGLQWLKAGRMGYESNAVPFVLDPLPDEFDREPNDTPAAAQPVELPVIVNGRIDRHGDTDVFQFSGKANDRIVVEVEARRLDSPVDSVVKLTDAAGKLIGYNDDREDVTAGLNTHHADSYFMTKLPADGVYYVHIADTAQHGGPEYGYRLRISAPQPDFELRVVPTSFSLVTNASGAVTVYAVRKDGFAGPIKLTLKDPPPGFSLTPSTLTGAQAVARLTLKGGPKPTKAPVRLSVVGSARIDGRDIVRQAVPAEDRMQAFLWRHLVPARDLDVVVYERNYQPPPKRVPPARTPSPAVATQIVAAVGASAATNATSPNTAAGAAKPKFTKQQIVGRLRQLKVLYEEGLLTDRFYDEKVAECETGP